MVARFPTCAALSALTWSVVRLPIWLAEKAPSCVLPRALIAVVVRPAHPVPGQRGQLGRRERVQLRERQGRHLRVDQTADLVCAEGAEQRER